MDLFKLLAVAVAAALWSAFLAVFLRQQGVRPLRRILDDPSAEDDPEDPEPAPGVSVGFSRDAGPRHAARTPRVLCRGAPRGVTTGSVPSIKVTTGAQRGPASAPTMSTAIFRFIAASIVPGVTSRRGGSKPGRDTPDCATRRGRRGYSAGPRHATISAATSAEGLTDAIAAVDEETEAERGQWWGS